MVLRKSVQPVLGRARAALAIVRPPGFAFPAFRSFSTSSSSSSSVSAAAENDKEPSSLSDPFSPRPVIAEADPDSVEVKDANLIFDAVWTKLIDLYGEENLCFPKDIMWLAGAPGSGKGVMTNFIMNHRGFTAKPIEVSNLLSSPEMEQLKQSGALVGDKDVLFMVLNELVDPKYRTGALVDGFPRTKLQGECINILFDRMRQLRRKFEHNQAVFRRFRRPIFHITVLFVEEELSIGRQLNRGKQIIEHNEVVDNTGVGEHKVLRGTDTDPALARERYRNFKEHIVSALDQVKHKFQFHFIDASGTVEKVQERIVKEMEYQSKNELADDTFEKVRRFPLASEIIVNARHELVKRLDSYSSEHEDLFNQVVDVLASDFVPIVKRQALTGRAIIRTEDRVFEENKIAIDMALDLMTERGFRVVLDKLRSQRPHRVLPDGTILFREHKVLEFQIEFQPPNIRGQHASRTLH